MSGLVSDHLIITKDTVKTKDFLGASKIKLIIVYLSSLCLEMLK